ncbi:MAG: ATP-binding protein [Lachnospiraceae bacterium]|nr:ATP-binding protein [Lachnospiraceae bacterium]
MILRTNELKELQKFYEKAGNGMVLLYGSNRSDKELLLRAFCKDKKVFYYRGRNASPAEQLRQMQAQIVSEFDVTLQKNTYEECFNRIKSGDSSKLVVVIDEFQTIAKKDPTFFESLIKLKKRQLYPGPVMIVLCNSSLLWTRRDMDECLGADAAAIDERFFLDEFHFLDIVRAFPKYSVAEAVRTYGILGGVPEYVNRWNGERSVKENVCSLILNPRGFLHHEAENYISGELRELAVYETILAAMARGNSKLNDLYHETGYSRAKISVYLKNLAAFDIVEKVVSFETGGWDNAMKGIYRIKNHFVEFWFRFIYPNQSALYMMSAEQFYDTYIASELDDYLDHAFVKVCREYLELMNMVDKCSIKVTRMGTWIGKNGTIDIIGADAEDDYVVGICNWNGAELTFDAYQELLGNMQQAKIHARTTYLFSATAFEERLQKLAQEETSLVLVDMTEL